MKKLRRYTQIQGSGVATLRRYSATAPPMENLIKNEKKNHNETTKNETIKTIEKMIYMVRGKKVMLDSDLAKLYGVETKALNQAVKRNLDRFPIDFSFQCTLDDLEDLRSQFVTANLLTNWNDKRRTLPFLFTENGVAMLSSVLTSKRAIGVNIAIMRIFTRLRGFVAMGNSSRDLEGRVDKLEKKTERTFKIVFKRLDSCEEKVNPRLPDKRKKIGLK